MIKIDEKAPKFKLSGDDGKTYSLEDFKDKKLVIYFYPKDNTSGCTVEAQEFTESIDSFTAEEVTVLGISPDSIKSHLGFKEKIGIKFTLLSDPENVASTAYEAYGEKSMYGKKYMGIIRSTFYIKNGVIAALWTKVKAAGHAAEVLAEIKKLK